MPICFLCTDSFAHQYFILVSEVNQDKTLMESKFGVVG